jgi:hypothetical protein
MLPPDTCGSNRERGGRDRDHIAAREFWVSLELTVSRCC